MHKGTVRDRSFGQLDNFHRLRLCTVHKPQGTHVRTRRAPQHVRQGTVGSRRGSRRPRPLLRVATACVRKVYTRQTRPRFARTARTASRARRTFRAHGGSVVRARQPHERTAGGPPQRSPARRGSRGWRRRREKGLAGCPVRLAGCRALATACRVRGGPRRSPLGLLPPPHLRLAATGSAAGLAPTPGPATPPPPRPLSLSLRRGAHCYEHLLCAGGPLDQGG